MKWTGKIMQSLRRMLLLGATFAAALSCDRWDPYPTGPATDGSAAAHPSRVVSPSQRKVLLVYSAGYNSLQSYLKEDLQDLQTGYIPRGRAKDDVLLVLSHLTAKAKDYTTPVEPVLYRLYTTSAGEVVSDTLQTYPHGAVTTGDFLAGVLEYIHKRFPAKSYGMVFSSHGSGWCPPGYFNKPEDKYFDTWSWSGAPRHRASQKPLSSYWPEAPDGPAVKSVGQEQIGAESFEMTLKEFASAFPMHFDYILIDACLMGGVEVAYELKDICDQVGFSPAEVLADGFNYTTLTQHLLENETPDPKAVCEEYFNSYNQRSGSNRSATITLVNCAGMDALAATCKTLFETYREPIAAIEYKKVQNFGRRMADGGDRSWFFDLYDVFAKAGATAEDLALLQASLDECMLYKAATPVLLGSIPIRSYSGLTTYLPAYGTEYQDSYYKEHISWNQATEFIK